MRLQLEILKISNDETLFAWEDASLGRGGLLAPSPRCFKSSYDIRRAHTQFVPRLPYGMTNKGLQFEAKLFPRQKVDMPKRSNVELGQTYLCPLNCVREGNTLSLISLLLSRSELFDAQILSRVGCGSLETLHVNDIIAESLRGEMYWRDIIFVSQPEPPTPTISRNRGQCTFKINFQRLLSCGFTLNEQVLPDSELGYWLKNTEDGVLVLKLFNSRAHILFGKLKQVIALEVSCQGAPCFVLSVYRDNLVDQESTVASYLPNSGFSFEHSRRGGEEHCGSSEMVLMVLKKKIPSRLYFNVELTIKNSKDEPLGKTQETNPIKGLWIGTRKGVHRLCIDKYCLRELQNRPLILRAHNSNWGLSSSFLWRFRSSHNDQN
jgi:hypothetical protein